jgi:hypothetical protein
MENVLRISFIVLLVYFNLQYYNIKLRDKYIYIALTKTFRLVVTEVVTAALSCVLNVLFIYLFLLTTGKNTVYKLM